MSMSDKQVRKLLFGTIETLTSIPVKQRDRIKKTVDFKTQKGLCLNLLLHAVELFTWNDYYERMDRQEMEWQSKRSQETARERDQERSRSLHLCKQEEYHA